MPIENAILAGLCREGEETLAQESLDELERLAETAGAALGGRVLQRRKRPDVATYFGMGKVEELKVQAQESACSLLIVDDELRPSQQRNLEEATGLTVLDRTQLILDIFAQRARSGEGKLQVELAQLSYLLPRLIGMNRALSRLGGGIGTRGPGETKLESDRRRLRERIGRLKDDIEELAKSRGLQRDGRRKDRVYSIAFAGYTNAGKSSLFNALTDAKVYVRDQLFATLDPTLRAIRPVKGQLMPLLLFDTVGFIRKLPHALVAAFRATLEEIAEAELIVKVLDASSADFEAHLATVDEVLEEILKRRGDEPLAGRATLVLFNKVDLLSPRRLSQLKAAWPDAFFVSAQNGKGLETLAAEFQRRSEIGFKREFFLLPADKAGLLAKYYDVLAVQEQKWGPRGVRVEAILKAPVPELEPYKTEHS